MKNAQPCSWLNESPHPERTRHDCVVGRRFVVAPLGGLVRVAEGSHHGFEDVASQSWEVIGHVRGGIETIGVYGNDLPSGRIQRCLEKYKATNTCLHLRYTNCVKRYKGADCFLSFLINMWCPSLRGGFFLFLADSGSCMRPAAKKSKKKHTEHERVQLWGTTEHERGPYTHATRQKHTLNTRGCSFEYQ